ncbi:MAG: membrane protein insertase YidC [Albidovulum sp.]|nr:membrane protein insertase YidC [Albidovulum sp.]MDE0304759.1 membrane protein insertase YidC [Albidovulum sp.]MDE0534544.1 membrane protein insertase YidC [Albidovulum sp.]
MDEQNKNLILATALSFLVILAWFLLFPPEEPPIDQATQPASGVGSDGVSADAVARAPAVAYDATGAALPPGEANADSVSTPRIEISTDRLKGSISLVGGRIDDLLLNDYRESLDEESANVRLLTPADGKDPYYALYGWAPAGSLGFSDVPGVNTPWNLESGQVLTPDQPVSLVWDNGKGLVFRREISIDENYLFSISQSVSNFGSDTVRLAPYGIIARHGEPDVLGFFILHEGIVRIIDGELEEIDYSDMPDLPYSDREAANIEITPVTSNGWVGFTDKYWMTTLIPNPGQTFASVAKYTQRSDIYQTEMRLPTIEVGPGIRSTSNSMLFAGAKEWETINDYEQRLKIDRFVDSIDWGWFFFLTKPIFRVLYWINGYIGNLGWSIIGLTLIIKAILFPLAYKSYVSMARMKELQPEMEKIKERVGDDRKKLQSEMMQLYKKNKVNPASGCLPILPQIPIFYSLYKVIFVTIELRHAPFALWIRDLSAPDPTSILNLFGLLPWSTPEPGTIFAIVSLGVLPILLGVTMWLQQKLNPAPTDPTQAMIFAWLPWIFMFMLGQFASGLIIYWIANNTITFAQQYAIMRSQGVKPDVLGNIVSGFRKRMPMGIGPFTRAGPSDDKKPVSEPPPKDERKPKKRKASKSRGKKQS